MKKSTRPPTTVKVVAVVLVVSRLEQDTAPLQTTHHLGTRRKREGEGQHLFPEEVLECLQGNPQGMAAQMVRVLFRMQLLLVCMSFEKAPRLMCHTESN